MNKNYSELPLRTGVGIILLNNDNKSEYIKKLVINFGWFKKPNLTYKTTTTT